MRKATEDKIGLQSAPTENVITSSKKTFSRDVFKLSNKDFNFAQPRKF